MTLPRRGEINDRGRPSASDLTERLQLPSLRASALRVTQRCHGKGRVIKLSLVYGGSRVRYSDDCLPRSGHRSAYRGSHQKDKRPNPE
jgi:hypothetical protein